MNYTYLAMKAIRNCKEVNVVSGTQIKKVEDYIKEHGFVTTMQVPKIING